MTIDNLTLASSIIMVYMLSRVVYYMGNPHLEPGFTTHTRASGYGYWRVQVP
jgi:hypothetical protein